MKTVEHYECELCGKKFDYEEEAVRHENRHILVTEIVKSEYAEYSRYPIKITVKMSNDQQIVYDLNKATSSKEETTYRLNAKTN